MKFRRQAFPLLRMLISKSRSLPYFALLLIIVLGTILTVWLYHNEHAEEARWVNAQFHEETEDYYTSLQRTIERTLDDIATLTACYRTSQDLNRKQFTILARHLLAKNPCLQALEWLECVPDSERNTWEESVRKEGYPLFQITERDRNKRMIPAARRPEYYVISYLEPYQGNEAALGYDPSSEPTRRIALYKSRDMGELISSDWVQLVQGQDPGFGIVISSPVYRNGLPTATPAQRRQAFQGFVVGVIKVQKIIEAAWGYKKNPGLDIHLFDLSAYSEQSDRNLHSLDLGHGESWKPVTMQADLDKPAIEDVRTIQVADHAWRIHFSPLPSFFQTYQRDEALRTLLIGISTTIFLAAYIYFLLNRTENARRHAAELAHSQVELQESRERFAGIIAMATDAIISFDEHLKIILFNRGAEKSFGYQAEEVIGRPLGLLLPGMLDESENDPGRLLCTDPSDGPPLDLGRMVSGLCKDGKEFPAEARVSRLKMGGARLFTIILRDRSEQTLLESQLRHAQKMEAVGQLAGGVAHDFNNILTVIVGNASILMNAIKPPHPHHDLVDAILDAGTRATAVTRQLLAFSRKQVLQTKVLNLNTVITEMGKVLRRLIQEDIRVSTILGPELWKTRADPSQIDQVIVNLMVNARDAMPDGGALVIETGNIELAQRLVTVHGALEAGQYVLLTVRDQGIGMDDLTLTHIFEPFFTTKAEGRGTGLGLATVYGIVKQFGGSIVVDSKPGQGTTFRIYFPRTLEQEAAQGKNGMPQLFAPVAAQARILVVEDDDLLRNFIFNTVQRWGFPTRAAASGAEALDLLRAERGRFDLLVTDVVMPGMSGAELAKQVARDHPQIKVLFMSGYPRDNKGNKLLELEDASFIPKPFTARDLLDKIQRILEHPSKIDL